MKKTPKFYVGYLVLILAMIGFSGSAALAAPELHEMTGKISAITAAENVVVVKCPMGSTFLTVGGQLGSKAKLMKGNKSVSLNDFKVGDHVRVGWKSTANGPVIEHLSAK